MGIPAMRRGLEEKGVGKGDPLPHARWIRRALVATSDLGLTKRVIWWGRDFGKRKKNDHLKREFM